MKITGVKVFSATMMEQRALIGERVTEWIAKQQPTFALVDMVVTQSSDHAFHMVAITVFYGERGAPAIDHVVKTPSTAKLIPTTPAASAKRLKFSGFKDAFGSTGSKVTP